MGWILFKEEKPKEKKKRIFTRSPGFNCKNSDSFEDWRIWNKDILTYKPTPTHFWKGIDDFDYAISQWEFMPKT